MVNFILKIVIIGLQKGILVDMHIDQSNTQPTQPNYGDVTYFSSCRTSLSEAEQNTSFYK